MSDTPVNPRPVPRGPSTKSEVELYYKYLANRPTNIEELEQFNKWHEAVGYAMLEPSIKKESFNGKAL